MENEKINQLVQGITKEVTRSKKQASSNHEKGGNDTNSRNGQNIH